MPLSSLPFNLVIEMLGLAVKQNPEIQGVHIGQEEHKIILYDDNVTFLKTRAISQLIFSI